MRHSGLCIGKKLEQPAERKSQLVALKIGGTHPSLIIWATVPSFNGANTGFPDCKQTPKPRKLSISVLEMVAWLRSQLSVFQGGLRLFSYLSLCSHARSQESE